MPYALYRRRKKINMLNGYNIVAVVMKTPDTVLNQRLLNRPGKNIPSTVISRMKADFVCPSESEGFSEVIVVDC